MYQLPVTLNTTVYTVTGSPSPQFPIAYIVSVVKKTIVALIAGNHTWHEGTYTSALFANTI